MTKYSTASHDVFISPSPDENGKFVYRWVARTPVDVLPIRRNFESTVDAEENARIVAELDKMVADGIAVKSED